jgi:phosphatidylserine/phosphatidylglycerophosphate/cardiolipin synthase-like enzyme
MTSSAVIKRLEALERAIMARPPTLIFVWTRSLADRIEPLVPQGRNVRLVCWAMDDEDGSFEAELRETNPREAARLDALLRGEIPTA